MKLRKWENILKNNLNYNKKQVRHNIIGKKKTGIFDNAAYKTGKVGKKRNNTLEMKNEVKVIH